LSDPQTKRNPVDIIAEILELWRKPTAKTQTMRKTNMSYPGMQKFAKQLLELELLKTDPDSQKYQTTEKGLEFLRRYSALSKLLRP